MVIRTNRKPLFNGTAQTKKNKYNEHFKKHPIVR